MKQLKLMILCNDAESALEAQDAGVDRVFYDMEFIGKAERQHGRNTVKSDNKLVGFLLYARSLTRANSWFALIPYMLTLKWRWIRLLPMVLIF